MDSNIASVSPMDYSFVKNLILDNKITEPVLFENALESEWKNGFWFPRGLNEWANIFDSDKPLTLKIGSTQWLNSEPQWESQCKTVNMIWSEVLDFAQNKEPDSWIYFDYKYMKDVMGKDTLDKVSWEKFGFPERNGEDSTLWIGTKGAHTPCHFDTYGANLVAQVHGRKKWILFPPEDTVYLKPTRVPYEESSVYSRINLLNSSKKSSSDLRKCSPVGITLNPSDVLFVPPKWWHFVQSEDFSISINTWIPLNGDDVTRIDESIARLTAKAFTNLSHEDNWNERFLNPNEIDLTKSPAKDLCEILKLCSLTCQVPEEGRKIKKQRLDITNQDFEYLCSLQSVKKLGPHIFPNESSQVVEEENGMNKEQLIIKHLFNAITHPEILKKISEQFLKNLKSD